MKVRVKRKSDARIVEIHTEFIKLQDFLKFADIIPSGGMAKMVIQDGAVTVNQEVELQRGKKLHDGDVVGFDGHLLQVKVHEA